MDSVVEQANGLTNANSYLGQASKYKINAHLESIRSIEKELLEANLADTQISVGENPNLPKKSDYTDPGGISFYDAKSGPQTGPKVDLNAAGNAFKLSGKLFVLGFYTDALRFGSLIFKGAGGHLRFVGDYDASSIGRSLDFSKRFDSASCHDAIFHRYDKNAIRVYQHYCVSQLAYVLQEMDKLIEPNGKSVLDNSLTVIATEYGKNHQEDGDIFHAVVGGDGKFKPGQYDTKYGFNDVYKTLMDAYAIQHDIGGKTIDALLS